MTSARELAYAELPARVAREAATDGRPVVGIVGRDVPAVLVTAAGARAFRLRVAVEPSEEAWQIMGKAVDRAASGDLMAAT